MKTRDSTVPLLPEKEEEFEEFLRSELRETRDQTLASSTVLVARRQFYQTHYERLFPEVVAPPVPDGQPRKFRMRVSPEALERGQDLCAEYLSRYPGARDQFLKMPR